jgi:hypothetical protein
MPYDHEEETGYIEHIVEGKRVSTEDGRYGIYQRAEERDISEEDVKGKLEKYDEIFRSFSFQMGLMEYENDAIYYHRNIEREPAKLDMAYTMLKENSVSSEVYFIVDYNRALRYDIPLLVVRLNDRLGIEGKSNSLTVWGYDSSKKEFTNSREVKSLEENTKIYKELGSYLRNEPGSADPFFKVASSIHSL